MKLSHIIYAVAVAASMGAVSQQASASDRSTYTAWQSQRGDTVTIPESRVRALCGDWDGCEIRMGMYNWDGTRRTASRSSLFYYEALTGNWRAERSDRAGRTDNNVTEHIMTAWACYFTDGYYDNWYNHGDINKNFAVLSWNQYNASCKVTLID